MKEFTDFVKYVNNSNDRTIKILTKTVINSRFDLTLNLSINNSFTKAIDIVKGIKVASNDNCNMLSNCNTSIATTTS